MDASTQDTNIGITTNGTVTNGIITNGITVNEADHPMSGVDNLVRSSSGTQNSPDQPSTTVNGPSVHPNDAPILRPREFMTSVPGTATRDFADPSSIPGPPPSIHDNETQPVEGPSRSISFEGLYKEIFSKPSPSRANQARHPRVHHTFDYPL